MTCPVTNDAFLSIALIKIAELLKKKKKLVDGSVQQGPKAMG
jgi:hypothetical protein